VVGVLSPTASVIDRLVLTSVESVWASHGIEVVADEHEDGHDADEHAATDHADRAASNEQRQAVTALLLRYRTPLAAVQLPPLVNQTPGLQAAAPALEMARLLSLIGVGIDTVRGFSLLLMATAGLSVFIALYNALQSRRYDLAVMRVMGASSRNLFGQLLLEGFLLAAGGALLGMLLGHGVASLMSASVSSAKAIGITGFIFLAQEFYVVGLALLIGLLAALIPAIQAYRTDIAMVLASGR
jgi:putative ABC transport system permease protein